MNIYEKMAKQRIENEAKDLITKALNCGLKYLEEKEEYDSETGEWRKNIESNNEEIRLATEKAIEKFLSFYNER